MADEFSIAGVVNALQLGCTLKVYKSNQVTLNAEAINRVEGLIRIHLVRNLQKIREEERWGNSFNTRFTVRSDGGIARTYCVVAYFFENDRRIAKLQSHGFNFDEEIELPNCRKIYELDGSTY